MPFKNRFLLKSISKEYSVPEGYVFMCRGRDLNPWNDSLINKPVNNLFIGEHCYKI